MSEHESVKGNRGTKSKGGPASCPPVDKKAKKHSTSVAPPTGSASSGFVLRKRKACKGVSTKIAWYTGAAAPDDGTHPDDRCEEHGVFFVHRVFQSPAVGCVLRLLSS